MRYAAVLLVLGVIAFSAPSSRRLHLPTAKVLDLPLPGSPQPTNSLPTVIAISPDGRYAALLNNGYGTVSSGIKQSIAVLDFTTGKLADFPDDRLGEDAHQSYFLGLAFSSDGARLYASMGSITDPTGVKPGNLGNGIAVYRFAQGQVTPETFLTIAPQPVAADRHIAQALFKLGRGKAIPYPAGIAVFSRQGHDQLLVANNLSDTVIVLDPQSGRELSSFDLATLKTVPGSFPYGVVVSRDGRRAWCSLWNVSQVAELDLEKGTVVRRIPLLQPSSATASGSHPTALLLSPDENSLYVALANADAVAVIATASGQVQRIFSTALPGQKFAGAVPNALAQSADGRQLFVANAGTNSIAVIDPATAAGSTATPIAAHGFIPTEWYPTALAVRGNELLIASGKGQGSGPNAERGAADNSKRRKNFPYIPTLIHGSLARLPLADLDRALSEFTHQAEEQNLLLSDPGKAVFPGGANPIRHVIYIIKENRTYDQVLGDLKVGDGDSTLNLYGNDITPNQHKLALQFGVLDNFYDSGEVSGDGHLWSTAATTTDYNEKTWQIGYRSRERTYDYEGQVGDEYPLFKNEPDVSEPATGYLWGNAARHGLSYRHYGEFVASEWCEKKRQGQPSPKLGTPSPPGEACSEIAIPPGEPLPSHLGQPKGSPNPYQWPIPVLLRNLASKPELRDHFDPRFADFKEDYPDQLRVDEFLNEFADFVRARKLGNKSGELPNYVLLRLGNDHTAGTHPHFPTPAASVADNDLAVGRVVEAVSHSHYWDDTAILIVEDDAQDGPDHVDAHRSMALVISKYSPGSAQQPHLEHGFFTTVNLVHTLEAVLGLPPMNQNDAWAPLMISMFSGAGNQTPYTADYRNRDNSLIYQANKSTAAGARESARMDFSHADAADARLLNVILWRDRKGNTPMPAPRHTVLPASAHARRTD